MGRGLGRQPRRDTPIIEQVSRTQSISNPGLVETVKPAHAVELRKWLTDIEHFKASFERVSHQLKDGTSIVVGEEITDPEVRISKGKNPQDKVIVGRTLPLAVNLLPAAKMQKQGGVFKYIYPLKNGGFTNTYYDPVSEKAYCDCPTALKYTQGMCIHQLAAILQTEVTRQPRNPKKTSPEDNTSVVDLHEQLKACYQQYMRNKNWKNLIKLCEATEAYLKTEFTTFSFRQPDIVFESSTDDTDLPDEPNESSSHTEAAQSIAQYVPPETKSVTDSGQTKYFMPAENGWPELSNPSVDTMELGKIVRRMECRSQPVSENDPLANRIGAPSPLFVLTRDMKAAAQQIVARREAGFFATALYGPPGSGKDTLAEEIAHQLQMPLVPISAMPNADIQELMGGTGLEEGEKGGTKTQKMLGDLAIAATRKGGSVIVFDEFDRYLVDQQVALNRFLQSGEVEVTALTPEGKPFTRVYKSDPNTFVLITYNEYRGRLDESVDSRVGGVELRHPYPDEAARVLARNLNQTIGKRFNHEFTPKEVEPIAQLFYGQMITGDDDCNFDLVMDDDIVDRTGTLIRMYEDGIASGQQGLRRPPTPRDMIAVAGALIMGGKQMAIRQLMGSLQIQDSENPERRSQSRHLIESCFNSIIDRCYETKLPMGILFPEKQVGSNGTGD